MSDREEFNKQLHHIIANKNKNNVYLNKTAYEQILKEVMEAKQKEHFKTPLDYRRLQRYDIITVGKEKRLISPIVNNDGNPCIKYFVTTEELFDVIHNAHLSIGHGGRNRLLKELNDEYKNITVEAIMLYLSLCKLCQQKSKGVKKEIVIKPISSNELNSRSQMDLIDLQTQPDNEFNFILNYQDHLTKFVVLRPLKRKTAVEVAENLLEIFTLLGAPSILHSNNGRDFVNETIKELTNLWDGIKIVHGKPRHLQCQRANQDVQNMLSTWMVTNNTTKWSHGLKFVQMMKNRAYHDGIKQTPYEALFGVKMKLGLKTSFLPDNALTEIYSEEDLTNLIEATTTTVSKEIESVDDATTSRVSEEIESVDDAATSKVTEEIQSIDPRNLLCVVMENNDEKYKLDTKEGIRNQFSVCKQKFLSINEVPNVEKSVEEVVAIESLTGSQGFKKCTCRGKCTTKKCSCKSAQVLCNSKCHGSTSCSNKN